MHWMCASATNFFNLISKGSLAIAIALMFVIFKVVAPWWHVTLLKKDKAKELRFIDIIFLA